MRHIVSLVLIALAALPACSVPGDEASDPEEAEAMQGIRQAHLRIARPTDDLEAVVAFYRDGLGFDVIGSFEDHEGFDGVMLGHRGMGYHLELTHQQGHEAGRAPNEEHLLVFYLPDPQVWRAAVEHLESQGHEAVPSNNPYWDRRGKTFEDPDGYRVVLQNAAWGD